MSRTVAKLNAGSTIVNSDSYFELDEGLTYDVRAMRASTHREGIVPGEVNVTQEVRVESHVV